MVATQQDLYEVVRGLQGDEGRWGLTEQPDPVAESAREIASRSGMAMEPLPQPFEPNPVRLEDPPVDVLDPEADEGVGEEWPLPPGGQADDQVDPITDARAPKALVAEVPTGVCLPWTGEYDNVPAGYLFANGAAVSRETYAALFAVEGTRYGAGDGTTTFNIPDTREKYWRGALTDEARDNATDRGLSTMDLDHQHDVSPEYTTEYVYDTAPAGAAVVGADLAAVAAASPTWLGTSNPPTIDEPDGNHEITNEPPHWIGPGIIKT